MWDAFVPPIPTSFGRGLAHMTPATMRRVSAALRDFLDLD
jgi:hypothetical protein